MLKAAPVLMVITTLLLTSCASINSGQDRELRNWQAKNLEVREKDPTAAAALNVLPGIGDFYNGNIGYGIINLLTWPVSILWAPVGGANGAKEVNYFATKAYVEELEGKKKKVKSDIEMAFIGKEISREEFIIANRKIENMNLIEFEKPLNLRDIVPLRMEDEQSARTPTSVKE